MMGRFDFTLKQYKHGENGDFYIQCKGLHSGKPLRSPIPNCFTVYTDIENLFEIVYSLYKGGYFEPNICGSVVPFIRIHETRHILRDCLNKFDFSNLKKLQTIGLIDNQITSLQKQIDLMRQLQKALCREVLA